MEGVRRVPYRLPRVLDAVATGETVLIVEGEKDVEAVERAGEVATCNPGGAGKWRDEYNAFLHGARVMVVADDDEPGHRHAADVARRLEPVAASVTVWLPATGAKDLAQHLGMGKGLDHLRPFTPEVKAPSDWDPPTPLGRETRPPVFPAHRLPPYINDYCVGVADMLQTPVDLPCMLALSVLGAIAGGRCVVEVRPEWREPLNLYTTTAMDPGERKTPVFMRMVRPLEEAEAGEVAAIRADVADARARKSRAQAQADKADQDAARASEEAATEAVHFAAQMRLMADEIVVPPFPRLLAEDATPESLASLLHEQGGRLAMFSDEGEVFNMMAGRYSSAGPNLGVYLKAHVGSPIRVDRKGRDPEIIERPALTLGLTIQPAMLAAISGIHGARGRGLLGRILWSVPRSRVGTRQVETPPVPEPLTERYLREMRVLYDSLKDWTDPVVLVFSPDANRAVLAYERAVEMRLAPGGDLSAISDWGAKLVGHVVRIAGLLHLATHGRDGFANPVSADIMGDAIAIGDYLAAHALVAFDVMSMEPVLVDARAVIDWLAGRDAPEVSRRDIFCQFQSRFRTVAALEPVIDLLIEHGYLQKCRQERPRGPGRPQGPRYMVNPSTRIS